jgi:two-component system, response regulator PdtaR
VSGQVQAVGLAGGRIGPLIGSYEPLLGARRPPRPPGGRDVPRLEARDEVSGDGGERILVVEDDYFVALTLEHTLTEAGYRVVAVAASGEEALDLAGRERPDLVLMDIRLAGAMDGIEAARVLRERGFRSVFASAHSDAETRQRGAPAEPLDWLSKPFTDQQLLATVAEALRRLRAN